MRVRLLFTLLLLLPASAVAVDEGAELVGTRAPGWEELAWLDGSPRTLSDLRGKVVLLRWWTDTCPYCAASARALNDLHAVYGDRGLVVIGVHHPKPPGLGTTPADVDAAAMQLGFRFPIAMDEDWSVLRRYWLSGPERGATSVTFLIDRDGVIRWVHPGPAYHLQVIDGDEGPRRDYLALQGAIDALLAQGTPAPPAVATEPAPRP